MNELTEEKFQELKEKVETKRREAERAEGALEVSMKRLKEEFECDTIEEAKALFKKQKKELERDEKEFKKKLKEYEDKWGDD